MQQKSEAELSLMLEPILTQHGVSPTPGYMTKVIRLVKERAFLIPDLWNTSWFFFIRPEQYDAQVFQKIWLPETSSWIIDFAKEVEKMTDFNKDTLHAVVQAFTANTGIKTGQLMNPLRLLMVGSNLGPGMMDLADVLGKEEFLGRIYAGLEKLT
jgi:glutamyl-tRNA synthetase